MKKRKNIEKLPDLQITELFLVKADWNRTFMGQIIRETTEDGNELIRGTVIINDGKAWSVGKSEEDLGNNLDDICTMKLDYNLHADPGKIDIIAGTPYFLNQMKDFELLKRTYPISEYDRPCDGYDYIMKNSSPEERQEWKLDMNELQRVIKEGEKYIYQVAKEGKEFKTMCLCFKNYEIIRKKIYKLEDD